MHRVGQTCSGLFLMVNALLQMQRRCQDEMGDGVEDERWPSEPGRTERDMRAVPCRYLDSHTVVSHGDACVAVPAHVHGCVGTVVALPVQGATRRVYVIFGLLF